MRVVRLTDAQGARNLRERLLPQSLTGEARVVRERELRMANPHLDLDRLEEGQVVVLPDEVEAEIEVEGEAAGLRVAMPEALGERLEPLRVRVQEAIAREAEEREVLRRDLRGRAIRAAAEADPAVAAQVERIREQLTEDARDARDREERLGRLVEQATADLEELQQRFG